MILGIDFGSSYTDFVLMDNKRLIKSISIKSDKLNLDRALKNFPLNKITLIKVTGCGAKKLKKKLKGITINRVDEIRAIGLGGKFISNKNKILVASIGSGTCIVSVDKKIEHISGIPIGGRTFLGFSRLLLKKDNCDEIFKLAEKGDLSRVDLLMREIYPRGIGLLNSKGSAAHFGNIKNPKKSDLALALMNMISQTIGTVVAITAKSENHKIIVFTGKLCQSKLIQEMIRNRILKFYKAKILFPKNAAVATAIGSIMDEWLHHDYRSFYERTYYQKDERDKQ